MANKETQTANDGYEKLSKPRDGANEKNGELKVVRASVLAEQGITGVVAEGIFEKKEPNKFDPAKNDYFVRNAETNTLYIINSTQGLAEQMELPEVMGKQVKVEYEGKIATKRGKGYHQFQVYAKPAGK